MIQIRPVSDLRNKFKEIENTVNEGHPGIFNQKRIWHHGRIESSRILRFNR